MFVRIAAFLVFIVSLSAADGAVAKAIGPACTGVSTTQKVSFVHVGDTHARFDLAEDSYSRIRAFLKRVRLENPYTLFTNAGDDHEKGSVAEQYSRGSAVTEATFAMQYDVRTIGNHDFAWGVDHLLAYSRDPYGMVLSSNTRYDGACLFLDTDSPLSTTSCRTGGGGGSVATTTGGGGGGGCFIATAAA